MELEKILENSINKYLTEKLQSDLDKHIGDMMDKIFDSMFSRSSEIYKSVQKQIEAKMDVNLRDVSLINYNSMIVNSIGWYLKKQIEENSLKPLENMIQNIVWKHEKEEITFNELIDLIHRELYSEVDKENADDGDMLSIYAEHETNEYWKYIHIYCDTHLNVEKEYCCMKLTVGNNTSIISFEEENYKGIPYWPHEFYRMSNLGQKLYKMYVSGTKINFENIVYEDWEIEIDDREISLY